jgi:hypothetical protein
LFSLVFGTPEEPPPLLPEEVPSPDELLFLFGVFAFAFEALGLPLVLEGLPLVPEVFPLVPEVALAFLFLRCSLDSLYFALDRAGLFPEVPEVPEVPSPEVPASIQRDVLFGLFVFVFEALTLLKSLDEP